MPDAPKKASNQTQIIPLEDDPHREDPQGQRQRGEQVAGFRVLHPGRWVGQIRPSDIVRKPEALVPEPGWERSHVEEN